MATLLDRSLALLRAPANAVGYRLRARLRWSRGDAVLATEPKDTLFDWLDPAARTAALATEQRFVAHFDLADLRRRSTVCHYAENLAMLEGLERLLGDGALPVGDGGLLRAVDVGSGVFQYATALQRFCARGGVAAPRRVELLGVECDGHGIYRDRHSRADHARAHAALAGRDVRYEVADFTAGVLPPQEIVTLWFPFLSRYALLRWGLPLALFRPHALLRRAVATLRPGGLLVVANQTAAEGDRLAQLLGDAPVRCERVASLATELVPYRERTQDRRGSVWRRLG